MDTLFKENKVEFVKKYSLTSFEAGTFSITPPIKIIDQIIKFYGLRFFIDEFGLSENNIHEFVTSTYQNYPLEENFKAGNYTLVIDYFKKNFKRLNY